MSTATPNSPPEPLTIDAIRRAMLRMPPRETWLSSQLFPLDAAFVVEGSGERFTCAHPSFWARMLAALAERTQPAASASPFGFDLSPIEIDPHDGDSTAAARWRTDHWYRLREAVEVAMVPLPEWLKRRDLSE